MLKSAVVSAGLVFASGYFAGGGGGIRHGRLTIRCACRGPCRTDLHGKGMARRSFRKAIPLTLPRMAGLILLSALAMLVIGWLATAAWLLVRAFNLAADAAQGRAVAVAALGAFVAGLPWIGWAGVVAVETEQAKGERVPTPLRVERTEYALEKSWGIGMPGDNETGFVVYRLTPESIAWLRLQGPGVAASLGSGWRSTPITPRDGRDPWSHGGSRASSASYMRRYGFSIPVDPERLQDADAVITKPGSLYLNGGGGSVTVLDPMHSRAYFIYAG